MWFILGILEFGPGVGEQDIEFLAIDDNIPEEDEYFTVILSNATGGAITGAPISTAIQITKNENAIHFALPGEINIEEPDRNLELVLTVVRQGPTDNIVTVQYRLERKHNLIMKYVQS